MVKITNITDKRLSRRLPSGAILNWSPGESKDVESKRVLEEVSRQECFAVGEEVGAKDVGGGLKTGVRRPKRLGRPPKSKKHLGKSKQAAKEKVKPPKSVIDKVKKPKGLKKKKGIGIDLDGDGKVDVVVGDD